MMTRPFCKEHPMFFIIDHVNNALDLGLFQNLSGRGQGGGGGTLDGGGGGLFKNWLHKNINNKI